MLQAIITMLSAKTPEMQLYSNKHTFVMGDVMVEVSVKLVDDIKLPEVKSVEELGN
jgi:hypothetical protein